MTARTATRPRRPISTKPGERPRRTPRQAVSRLSLPRPSLPRWSLPEVKVPKVKLPSFALRKSQPIDLRDTRAASEPVHPRIARRREQVDRESRRARPWLRWGPLAMAVASTVVVAGLFSPLADLDHLEVRGLEGEPAAAVREASGLVTGSAMFGVRPAEVRRRVESLPWVAHADVDARWPDTVAISVIPHRPLAFIEAPEASPDGEPRVGRSVLMTSGVVLDAADLGPLGPFTTGLPAVTTASSKVAPVGPDGSAMEYSEVARSVLAQLRPVTSEAVNELSVGASGAVTLVARVPGGTSEAVLALGGPEDLPAKAIALESVLSGTVELACLERLDVSVPTRVTIQRSGGCTIPSPGEAAE